MLKICTARDFQAWTVAVSLALLLAVPSGATAEGEVAEGVVAEASEAADVAEGAATEAADVVEGAATEASEVGESAEASQASEVAEGAVAEAPEGALQLFHRHLGLGQEPPPHRIPQQVAPERARR